MDKFTRHPVAKIIQYYLLDILYIYLYIYAYLTSSEWDPSRNFMKTEICMQYNIGLLVRLQNWRFLSESSLSKTHMSQFQSSISGVARSGQGGHHASGDTH